MSDRANEIIGGGLSYRQWMQEYSIEVEDEDEDTKRLLVQLKKAQDRFRQTRDEVDAEECARLCRRLEAIKRG